MREVGGLAVCDYHEDMKETVQDHELRIRTLEQNSIRLAERIDSLCQNLNTTTNWIKVLVGVILSSMVGFFIWYIQSLPR